MKEGLFMSEGRKAEAKRWFLQAGYDLEAVRWNIQGKFYDTACFLAQQSAEKALKSLLFYLGKRKKALLTHSLAAMIKEAGKSEKTLADLLDNAKELDLHYLPSRYPNGLPAGFPHQFYGKEMAEKALASARKIYEAVRLFYENKNETTILDST
jgi:HEPN domain-containing protein